MARTITEIDGKRYEVRHGEHVQPCAFMFDCEDHGMPCKAFGGPEYYFVEIAGGMTTSELRKAVIGKPYHLKKKGGEVVTGRVESIGERYGKLTATITRGPGRGHFDIEHSMEDWEWLLVRGNRVIMDDWTHIWLEDTP